MFVLAKSTFRVIHTVAKLPVPFRLTFSWELFYTIDSTFIPEEQEREKVPPGLVLEGQASSSLAFLGVDAGPLEAQK